MTRSRIALARFVWAVAAIYLVLSATFALVAFTPDPNAAVVGFGAARQGGDAEGAMDAYRAARNLDEPVVDRYVTFLVRLSTLDLGRSHVVGAPVTSVLASRLAVSLTYVIPSVLVSVLAGGAVGLYAATTESSLVDHLSGGTAYVLLALPNFWLAVVVRGVAYEQFGLFVSYRLERGYFHPENLLYLLLPATVLTTTLFAAQLRYVRSESREYLRADFVKTARAKGAGRWRVARHAVRNAVLPLLSLFFGELLAVLFVAVFVIEVVLQVPGFGSTGLAAIHQRDVPLVVGVALVPVVVGILGTFLHDVLSATLDPRLQSRE